MEPLIQIHFRKSRAKDFPDIIKRCKHFDDFTQGDVNKLSIGSVNELMNNWADFMVIATRVPNFVGSRAWFMGDEIVPFKPDFFYSLQDTLQYCYKGFKETSYIKTFCLHDWGCRRLSSIRKEIDPADKWTFHMHWYRYGHFEGDRWLIDKGSILNVLKREAQNNYLNACPAFDFERVKKAVDKLPDEIELNEQWQILKRTELKKDGFIEVPFSIAPAWIEPNEDNPGHLQFEIGVGVKVKKRIDPENMTEEEINQFLDEMNRKNNNIQH